MDIHASAEDYLERILMLRQLHGSVRSIDIANDMNFSKPSVSVAMKKLRENGYIEVDADGQIHLTDKGYQVASEVYERHQVLTLTLMKLGVSERQALEDACKIEHDLSEESFLAIKKYISEHK